VYNNLDVDRFINSASAQWRPVSWIQTDGTAGFDYAQRDQFQLCRLAECPASGTTRQGFVFDGRTSDRNLSMKLNSTATWQPRTTLNLKTTIGADYVNQQTEFASANGNTLPPGAQSVGQAAIQTANVNPGTDTITFDLDPILARIKPRTALPAVTDAVVIDGWTADGASAENGRRTVEIDGSAVPISDPGSHGGSIRVVRPYGLDVRAPAGPYRWSVLSFLVSRQSLGRFLR
jgi:hypothetical protein